MSQSKQSLKGPFTVVISQGQGEAKVQTFRKLDTAYKKVTKLEGLGSIGIRDGDNKLINLNHNKTVEPGKTKLLKDKALDKLSKNISSKSQRKINSGTVAIYRDRNNETNEDVITISIGFSKAKKLRLVQAKLSLADFAKSLTGLSGKSTIEALFRS